MKSIDFSYEKSVDKMKSQYKIAIYGSGKYGAAILEFMKCAGIDVYCFLDSFQSSNEECYGIRKLSINIINKDNADGFMVILAINDDVSREKIRVELWKRGLNNSQIIEVNDFLSQNNILKNRKFCMLCNGYVETFYPAEYGSCPAFENNHIIGGGRRSNCYCPKCKSQDRYRWIYYVLKMHTDICEKKKDILWFAPEGQIISKIKTINPALAIYTANIKKGAANYIVDIRKMQFEDNKFDYLIANHVLEHVDDEERAATEVKRVLKSDGTWFLSFPIATNIDTLEDDSVKTDRQRFDLYGQEDHVRLYGRDFKKRIEKYGFHVKVFSPYMEFTDDEISEYGFIKDDIIMLCKKE